MNSALLHSTIRQLHAVDPTPDPSDEGSYLLEHPDTRLGCRLNASAVLIWDRLAPEVRFAALAAQISEEFAISVEEAQHALAAFVERLGGLGFLALEDGEPSSFLRRRYLDLLKAALVNTLYPEDELRIELLEQQHGGSDIQRQMRDIRSTHAAELADLIAHKKDGRVRKRKVNRFSHTMIGLRRLQNLEWCASQVFREDIAGDFLEAGVCQGGAAIFLRALQVAHGQEQRQTWVADSFAGLPKSTAPIDQGYHLHEEVQPWLAASLASVQQNFRAYDLLSDNVRFLQGWFAESLPRAPVETLAILRIDADLYSSTREVLDALYRKVAPGGYVIVDDYHAFSNCRRAVDDFRDEQGVTEPLVRIDWTGVFWRKQ